ncbi:hypothetical protein [Agrobacterium sp.]|uniref:hypothetical protein n=1 Tax=Agrobacterium sp. TaxID=361 RepID=UPI0028B1ADB8|nr:hypothetical protein [Agrobacterium sp.]
MVAFQPLLSSSLTELPDTEPTTFGRGKPLLVQNVTLPLEILTVVFLPPPLLVPLHVPSQAFALAALVCANAGVVDVIVI